MWIQPRPCGTDTLNSLRPEAFSQDGWDVQIVTFNNGRLAFFETATTYALELEILLVDFFRFLGRPAIGLRIRSDEFGLRPSLLRPVRFFDNDGSDRFDGFDLRLDGGQLLGWLGRRIFRS
jgi:hypothetical protein